MSEHSQMQDILRTVMLYRRKGDAAARRENSEAATQAWETGLAESAAAISILPMTGAAEPAIARAATHEMAEDAAEFFGVRAGLYRRLGLASDALECYRNGAVWEAAHDLPQTYNRMNAFKLALIVGDRRLAELRAEISDFRQTVEKRLTTDERAADDAWLWADLGDARLLLGDTDGAVSAYQNFVRRSRTDSPELSLTVLREVSAALDKHHDEYAGQVAAGLEQIEEIISR